MHNRGDIDVSQHWDANIIHLNLFSDTYNLEKVREISETLFTHPRADPKHPVKWRRYTTANIGPFAHSIRCDQFSAFVYAERARFGAGVGRAAVRRGCATYSFRSFRRAANQPTDRPTEVTSGANCGGCCGTACKRQSRMGRAGRGGSVRLANGSRRVSPRNSITRATPL